MQKGLITFLFVFVVSGLSAQTCSSDRYRSEVFTQLDIQRDVVYGNAPLLTPVYLGENVTVPLDLDMDIFQPAGDTQSLRPLFLWAFGGAFIIGNKEHGDMQEMCERFARRGFVTASINYRKGLNLTNAGSAERAVYRCTQDYSAAIRYFKEFAQQYRIDTNQIFVSGNSAGSFGALHVAYMDEADRPASTYGQGGLVPWPDLGCKDCSGNSYQHSSNVRAVVNNWGAIGDTNWINANNIKPTLSIHGDADNLVPFGVGAPFSADLVMPTVYGSSIIHPRLQNLGGFNRFIPLVGQGHIPWGIPGVPTAMFDPLYDSIANFTVDVLGSEQAITGMDEVCIGDVAVYSAQSTGGQYCWLVTGGTITNQPPNGEWIEVSWQQSGSVSLQSTSKNGLELEEVSQSVTVYPNPTVSISGDSATCAGGEITLNGRGAATLYWELADTTITTSSLTLGPDSSGLVSLYGTSTNGCKSDTVTRTYAVYALPDTPVVQAVSNVLGTSVADNYRWFFEGGAILNSNSQTILPALEGNYQVEVTTNNDCSLLSAPFLYFKADTNNDSTNVSIRPTVLEGISIFPNPFSNELTLQNIPPEVHAELSNIQGQKQEVSYSFNRGSITLNTTDLPIGIYVLNLHLDSAVRQVKVLKL